MRAHWCLQPLPALTTGCLKCTARHLRVHAARSDGALPGMPGAAFKSLQPPFAPDTPHLQIALHQHAPAWMQAPWEARPQAASFRGNSSGGMSPSPTSCQGHNSLPMDATSAQRSRRQQAHTGSKQTHGSHSHVGVHTQPQELTHHTALRHLHEGDGPIMFQKLQGCVRRLLAGLACHKTKARRRCRCTTCANQGLGATHAENSGIVCMDSCQVPA